MLTSATAFALAAIAGVVLWLKGRRDHAEALRERGALLDGALRLFPNGRITHGPAGFPSFDAALRDGRNLRLELFADTLVFRRLPQLWLQVTVRDAVPRRCFSIGALSRPTGSEFYSLVHGLPDWIQPPPGDLAMLVRGRDLKPSAGSAAGRIFADLFSDPQVKEAVASPRGVRIIRQVSEGDRASHLLLRQVRFAPGAVAAGPIERALEHAFALERSLEHLESSPESGDASRQASYA